MNVRECYAAMGGNYDEVFSRLRTDERITKFLFRVLEDKSFDLLTESLAAHNMEEAFRAAHTIKCVCMNLAITKLFESSNKLTETLRGRSEYGEDIEPLLAQVKEDYALTLDCIRALQ